jgi:hypothetical protein
MGLNFLEGKIDTSPQTLDTYQILPRIADLRHGNVMYAADEAWFVGYDRVVRIDGNFMAIEEEYMEDAVDSALNKLRETVANEDELDDAEVVTQCG